MPAPSVPYGSAYTENMFGIGLTVNAEVATMAMAYHGGEDSNAAFLDLDKSGNKRGDSITHNYLVIDEDVEPKGENDATVGAAQSQPNPLTQTISCRYTKFDSEILNEVVSQNNVSWSVRNKALATVRRRISHWVEMFHVYHLCGTTAITLNGVSTALASGSKRFNGNDVTAPDQAHWLRPDGVEVDGSTVTETTIAGSSGNVLTSDTIRELELRACSTSYFTYPIAMCDTPAGELYCFWCSPDGYAQLIDNSSASDIYDLSRARIQGGGNINDHPSIKAGAFIIHNTLVVRHPKMPLGQSSATVARDNVERAVFFGANAMTGFYADSYTDGNHWGWAEFIQLRDYWAMGDTIQGFVRSIVNGLSWASCVVSHYSKRTVA